MGQVITLHLPREKYTPASIVNFIKACLLAGGIPMFRTRFARVPFRVDRKRAVMAICYGGSAFTEPYSRVFYDIPREDLKLMKERVGEWIFLLKKYAPKEYERELKKLGEVM